MHSHARRFAAISLLLVTVHAPAAAQLHDPKTQSPLALVAPGPKDPLAYYDAKTRAATLVNQGKMPEAEPLLEQITRDYPRDGDNWFQLGYAKYALGKFTEAAAAFERAGASLSWGGGYPARSAAIANLKAGNRRAALDYLRLHAFGSADMNRSGFFDREDLASLRGDPEFLEIAGRPDATGWSRDYGWRRDVQDLRDEVKRLDAEYRDRPLPPEFERRYAELEANVPRLSDEQIYVGLNRMLAVLGQGHTAVWTVADSRVAFKALPLQFWVFPEGIFVVGASDENKGLIGSRLVSIEGVAAEEALRRVNETQSVDGDNEYVYLGAELLREAPYLFGLGITRSVDTIRVALQKPGESSKSLALATSKERMPNRLMPLPNVAAPLYLEEQKQSNWERALPEQSAMYLRVNMYDPNQSPHALALRKRIAEGAPKNLILDLRFNDGGSTSLYAELLRTLIGFSLQPERRLYVLIGRNTYSATGNLITELEQLANATFVGEPSSECCTLYASPSPFTLPYSKLRGRIPTRRSNLSRKGFDFRREMDPHVPVIMTAKDYFAGRDPLMDAVVRMIEREKSKKPE